MSQAKKSVVRETADALNEKARIAIPLGIALVAGVFVTLGIQGDALARLLRNSPGPVGAALTLAVVGVTLPLVLAWVSPRLLGAITVFAALLLVAAAVLAITVGIKGVGEREQPGLDIVGAKVGKRAATVQVGSSALSLASGDRMLLRVVTFSKQTPFSDAFEACRRTSNNGVSVTLPDRKNLSVVAPVRGARIVYWGETGPSADGTAETDYAFEVRPRRVRFVCAYAVLSTNGEVRSSTAILDLRNINARKPVAD